MGGCLYLFKLATKQSIFYQNEVCASSKNLIHRLFPSIYFQVDQKIVKIFPLPPPHPHMASDLQCHCLMRSSAHQQMAAPSYKYLERDGQETVTAVYKAVNKPSRIFTAL